MHCKTIQDRLTDFLEGKLAGSERRAVETHLALCAGCAEMLELMRLEPVGKTPPDLAVTILERTSGSPCERAWEILGDHVDGTLGELDTHLLVRHMNGCGECALLATTLTRLSEDLSVMAVLRQTTYSRSRMNSNSLQLSYFRQYTQLLMQLYRGVRRYSQTKSCWFTPRQARADLPRLRSASR